MNKRWRKLTRGNTPEDHATRRIVMALSISAFAEWGGASAVLPLLPVYLRHNGSSVGLIGLTMAAFFAAAVVVQYPLGRLSDRVGRRTIQVAGLVTYAVGSVLFAFVSAPLAALAFRALQGAGTGIVDVANSATIGEVVPEDQRGRAFGALYGTRTVGMAIGPFLGGLLGIGGMRWLFLASAAAVLAAALPIMYFTPRFAGHEPLRAEQRTPLWRNRSVLGVATAFLAGGIVVGMYEVCWSLLLTSRGAHSWQLGLSWTLFAIPFAVMSLPAGWLVDRMDRRYLTAVALFGTAFSRASIPSSTPSTGWSGSARPRRRWSRSAGRRSHLSCHIRWPRVSSGEPRVPSRVLRRARWRCPPPSPERCSASTCGCPSCSLRERSSSA